MIKEELHIMLGGNIVDVPLADEDYNLAIDLAQEVYSYTDEPNKHRRLALAECLTILGLAMSKFSNIQGIDGEVDVGGEIYLNQSNIIRESLRA